MPDYGVEAIPLNQEPNEFHMARIDFHPQITLESAERVFAELGWGAESRIMVDAREETWSHRDVVLPDKWTPGAFFLAEPPDRHLMEGVLIDGCIRAFFRFPASIPAEERQDYAENAFNAWKRSVALFLLEQEKERINAVLPQKQEETNG